MESNVLEEGSFVARLCRQLTNSLIVGNNMVVWSGLAPV